MLRERPSMPPDPFEKGISFEERCERLRAKAAKMSRHDLEQDHVRLTNRYISSLDRSGDLYRAEIASLEERHRATEKQACDQAESLGAEIASLKRQIEEAGWQPIETAPKDGKSVLIAWLDCFGLPQIGICWNDGNGWYPYKRKPLYWMPCPAPPAAIRARKDDAS